ncbi:MAG: hypothetical protein COV79_02950 [Parcubacteria group bacterium CG11_big_fil_rev_8_21_14_0_20_41_14]|nr:MAG: hypothetical protein COV79_02950 [Parcubacteria group bacterium CG11_big_fil_rev_8_21_14_0_20_41_14]
MARPIDLISAAVTGLLLRLSLPTMPHMLYPSIILIMSKSGFKKNNFDLFYELVRTDFVMRYHNSALGFVWVLLKPFLLYLIIMAVFSWLFGNHDPNYQLNLLLGLLLYNYFSESTLRGVTSLYDRSSVILKVNFPKSVAVYTSVVNSLISFLAGFVVFLIFWVWTKPLDSLVGLGYFGLQVLILSGLILGLNFFTGIIYTRLKDFLSVWEVLLQVIFWSTPIVYPASILPPAIRSLSLLNPLTIIVNQSRTAIVSGGDYHWNLTAYAAGITLILLAAGRRFFSVQVKKIAENF